LEIRGLRCDVEQLCGPTSRSGLLGFLRSGFDAALQRTAPILPLNHEIDDYDVVVVGTSVWRSGTMSAPVRSFLIASRARLKQVALFLTYEGSLPDSAFGQMQALSCRPVVSRLAVPASEVRRGNYKPALQHFADEVARAARQAMTVRAVRQAVSASTSCH